METRKQVLIEELETNAGNEPLADKFRTGYIACINDLLRMRVDDIQEIETDEY